MDRFKSLSNSVVARLALVLALCASLFFAGVKTQDAAVMFGSFNGAAKPVLVNSSGNLVLSFLAGTGTATYKAGGRLYFENTNTTTTVGSTNAVTGTLFSIPANTLAVNGSQLRIHISVTAGTAAVENKNIRCNIGYSSVNAAGTFTGGISVIAESSASNSGSFQFWVDGIVTRLGSASTATEWQAKWGSTSTTQGADYVTSATVDWTAANNFLCETFNLTASNTQTLRLDYYTLDVGPY